MSNSIWFNPRSVKPVEGGVMVKFDSSRRLAHAQIIETPLTVTITLVSGGRRMKRFADAEVFVPLSRPLAGRRLVDGASATELHTARAA